MESLLKNIKVGGIYKMFFILACVYFVMMFVGHLLLKKPAGWHEPTGDEKGPGMFEVIKGYRKVRFVRFSSLNCPKISNFFF